MGHKLTNNYKYLQLRVLKGILPHAGKMPQLQILNIHEASTD